MFHLPVYPVGNKLETQQKSLQLDLSSIGALKMSEICVLSSRSHPYESKYNFV